MTKQEQIKICNLIIEDIKRIIEVSPNYNYFICNNYPTKKMSDTQVFEVIDALGAFGLENIDDFIYHPISENKSRRSAFMYNNVRSLGKYSLAKIAHIERYINFLELDMCTDEMIDTCDKILENLSPSYNTPDGDFLAHG